MGLFARILETDGDHGKGMHPFQILLVRMSITLICSTSYLVYAKVPILGPAQVRWLLVLRGVGGFGGVVGFYCL